MKRSPNILVTNDDGITAPGIKALVEVAQEFGKVYVLAPDSPQSGQGHAITIMQPLRVHSSQQFGEEVIAYECSGTPADCVKIANTVIFKDIGFDLCLSGINHGSNVSINIIYSGTMSAAMEASLAEIPSIGFSLTDLSWEADFTSSKKIIREIVEKSLNHDFGKTKLLNVNIPNVAYEEIKGIKICHQGEARWQEDYQEAVDPRNQTYYWLTGKFVPLDDSPNADITALLDNFVTVVPSIHDLTSRSAIDQFKFLESIKENV